MEEASRTKLLSLYLFSAFLHFDIPDIFYRYPRPPSDNTHRPDTCPYLFFLCFQAIPYPNHIYLHPYPGGFQHLQL